MGENVIHTEHINKYYIMGDVEVRALNDISLDIDKGEFAAIMGPSGSGKSTLMNILGCLDRPTGGIYKLGGELVSEMNDSQLADVRNRKIGFVFQSFNLLPRSTALENVMLPTLYSKNKANAKQRAIDALEMVGLGSRLNHKPKEMSGGQQQRVAIARALINDPEIIMADEPTGNLDSKSGKEIMELLIRLNREQGKTIILVTHDPKIGRQVPRIISVFDGMLGSEEEQAELKRWTDANYSRLDGLADKKAALADDSNDNSAVRNSGKTAAAADDSYEYAAGEDGIGETDEEDDSYEYVYDEDEIPENGTDSEEYISAEDEIPEAEAPAVVNDENTAIETGSQEPAAPAEDNSEPEPEVKIRKSSKKRRKSQPEPEVMEESEGAAE